MGSFGRCRVWGFKKYGSRHRDGYWTGNRKRRIVYAVEEVNKIQEHGTSPARARHPEMGYGWADNERYMQDFELAFWQLTYLVVAPRRVYKQTYHQ